VIGYGRVTEMTDVDQKEYGLNQIMRHYSGQEWQFDPTVFHGTRVWCIEIDSLTGKRSQSETTSPPG
jgi:nitroimidazol reductase NimA-like FMN-containing flavoprotein (pyridoxamine 5'-phosphate oxidase superfamily)